MLLLFGPANLGEPMNLGEEVAVELQWKDDPWDEESCQLTGEPANPEDGRQAPEEPSLGGVSRVEIAPSYSVGLQCGLTVRIEFDSECNADRMSR